MLYWNNGKIANDIDLLNVSGSILAMANNAVVNFLQLFAKNAGLYAYGGFVQVTAWTAGNVQATVAYTDNRGTARTLTCLQLALTGGGVGASLGLASANSFVPATFQVQAGTMISMSSVVSGFTGVYDMFGWLAQIA